MARISSGPVCEASSASSGALVLVVLDHRLDQEGRLRQLVQVGHHLYPVGAAVELGELVAVLGDGARTRSAEAVERAHSRTSPWAAATAASPAAIVPEPAMASLSCKGSPGLRCAEDPRPSRAQEYGTVQWNVATRYRSCSVGRISTSLTATCRGRVTM